MSKVLIHTAARFAAALGIALSLVAAPSDAENEAQRAAHLLDYIAVDYPEAVRAGSVVNASEYQEQLEFVAQVETFLDALEGDPSGGGLERLREALHRRAPADRIAAEAVALSAAIRSHYGVRIALSEAPRPERGAALYGVHCANCHGTQGAGDGPAGAGLDPAPANLADPERMFSLSPFTVFSTISYGINGTGMVGYADSLSEQERIDLTFFAIGLAHAKASVERGRRIASREPRRAASVATSLDQLFDLIPREFEGDDRALLAHLVTSPAALLHGELPLEIARTRLAESRRAYRDGDPKRAMVLAVSAYLDGFEHIEPAIALVDGALRDETEAELMAFRGVLRAGPRDPVALEASYQRVVALFDRAEVALAGNGLSRPAVFLASFAILAREGLEAILLIAAILAVVSRASKSEAARGRRAIHFGWLSALVGGGLTWWAAQSLVQISGAQREVVEGVAALLAAAVLVWVSYWLFSRLAVEKWQAFLGARLEAAAAKGSLWVLGALAFLAVYREAFETVLFYQALAAQGAGASHERGALWAGAAAALCILAVAGYGVFFLGRRLPLRAFFAWSSVLLYVLAVVFAGQGINALQEAGSLPMTAVAFPRVAWLGVFPTLEGLGLQGALVALGLVAIPLSGALRREASPAQ